MEGVTDMPRKNKKIKNKKEIQKKETTSRKEQLIRSLDLPEEIMLNLPTVSLYGNKRIEIHNFKGLIEYTAEKIRINTSIAVLVVEGENLQIKVMTTEELHLVGNIIQVSYII